MRPGDDVELIRFETQKYIKYSNLTSAQAAQWLECQIQSLQKAGLQLLKSNNF